MKKAAMYVRVSTQQQKEEQTIESQKILLNAFANKKGFEIPSEWIFEDNGVTGSVLARPALDLLRDLSYEGVLETVFILSPDRLSRKYAYQVILMEEFKKNGVEIVFQNSPKIQTPADQLLLQMQGMFSEYERAQITDRSRRGKIHKAKNNHVSVLSHAPYAYRHIKGIDGCKGYYEIVEREAVVVRKIFDLYTKERLSVCKIKEYLFESNIVSPSGNKKWGTSSINNILKNSTYRGVAYYGIRETCDRSTTRLPSRMVRAKGKPPSKKSCRIRDKKDWIPIKVPSIIKDATFELAQDLFKENKERSIRNGNPGSLLQGLISCKDCGYGFTTVRSGAKERKNQYYRCTKQNKNCKNKGIRTEQLDEAIWDSLISLLESPNLIKNEIEKRLSEMKTPSKDHFRVDLEKKINKLEEESNRLLDAYQSGCIEINELKKRMSEIKKEKNNTSQKLAQMQSGLTERQLLELDEAVKYFSEKLK